MSDRYFLYLIDEQGGTFLFPSLADARRGLAAERQTGLNPGLFRIAVDRHVAEEFAAAVRDRTADEHPILEDAISGDLGDWQPMDLTTYEA